MYQILTYQTPSYLTHKNKYFFLDNGSKKYNKITCAESFFSLKNIGAAR